MDTTHNKREARSKSSRLDRVVREADVVGPLRVPLAAQRALRTALFGPGARRKVLRPIEALLAAAEGAAVDGHGPFALDDVVSEGYVGQHHRSLKELRQPGQLQVLARSAGEGSRGEWGRVGAKRAARGE